MRLIHGECLAEMDKLIAEGVKVDAIITDPPYGTTACKWDSVVPFDAMWDRLNKLIKPNGAIVLFGSEPFSSALRMSNIKNYKYDWVWNKNLSGNPFLAKKQPMKIHEIISVFYKKKVLYRPQMFDCGVNKRRGNSGKRAIWSSKPVKGSVITSERYPQSIINISKGDRTKLNLHPTQKPVKLMEYLIKTYTNKDETVLDFTMGSGTTGVACKQLDRHFIGIELDDKYFEIAEQRIKNHIVQETIK